MIFLEISAGLIFLIVGAEFFVRGASHLARGIGMPPLVIGLTVVAYGTSCPELAVSIKASLAGYADISVGNVVGSNIFNILFILGISGVIVPLAVSQQLLRLDIPVMIGVSLLSYLFAWSGKITRLEGILLLSGMVGYTIYLTRLGYRDHKNGEKAKLEKEVAKSTYFNKYLVPIFSLLGGLVILVMGSHWLVKGAVHFARLMGVSELLIGLTIVATGTSLPEVATSIVAAIRGERDIAIGNVVGSNIFNLLGVLGIASCLSGKLTVSPSALNFDIPVMIAVAFMCFPICFSGKRISRLEGTLFLGYYVIYLLYLIFKDTNHHALSIFNVTIFGFVVPATIFVLILICLPKKSINCFIF
jgi:cation:H+ antiporter